VAHALAFVNRRLVERDGFTCHGFALTHPRVRRFLKRLLVAFGALVVLSAGAVVATGCALSAGGYHGPKSDHFDGTRFFTPGVPPRKMGARELLKFQEERHPGPWSQHPDAKPGPPPPERVTGGRMRVTFVNHATTLIQMDGVNVLTDPIWSERASPFQFVGPKRVRPPGLRMKELPPIDAVVISHNHYDHLDLHALKRLQNAFPRMQILTGLGNRALLEGAGLEHVVELDWWQTHPLGAVTIHSVPNRHFSNRGLFDQDRTLWTAFVLEGPSGRAYFAGDTAYGAHFTQARERLGPMRLAVLPIGAYKPEWFMGQVHMSPAEAVRAAVDLQATVAVPMHYGTFPLADDGEDEPVQALHAALDATGKPPDFRVLGFGEGLEVPQSPGSPDGGQN
jgi:L-ascorbate metabolism protein UlaG (beta-lactamase superfamily)